MPPAGQCNGLKADCPCTSQFRILLHGIRQADACLKAPMEMLPLQESYAWQEAERPSGKLFFPVQRIAGVCIDIVGIGFCHIRNLWPQPYNHPCPVRLLMITCLAVEVGHLHHIRIHSVPSQVIDFSDLPPYACAGHYGPVIVQLYIQSVGNAQQRSWKYILGHAPRFGEQTSCNLEIVLQALAG